MFWTNRRRVAGMVFGVWVFKLALFSSGSMSSAPILDTLLGRPHDSGIFDRTQKKVIVYYEVAMECLRRKERPVRRSLVGLFTGTCQPCHDHYYV
jgi:hypothetical protein